jgi:hypothetical protein
MSLAVGAKVGRMKLSCLSAAQEWEKQLTDA